MLLGGLPGNLAEGFRGRVDLAGGGRVHGGKKSEGAGEGGGGRKQRWAAEWVFCLENEEVAFSLLAIIIVEVIVDHCSWAGGRFDVRIYSASHPIDNIRLQ